MEKGGVDSMIRADEIILFQKSLMDLTCSALCSFHILTHFI